MSDRAAFDGIRNLFQVYGFWNVEFTYVGLQIRFSDSTAG